MDYIWIKLIAVCAFSLLLSPRLSAGQNCQDCEINGVKFPGNKRFDYRVDCLEMTGCFCYCDGRSYCKKERNICDRTVESARDFHSNVRTSYSSSSSNSSSSSGTGSGGGQIIKDVRNGGCRDCIVDGGKVDGGTYFSHVSNCMSYTSCYCGCDGKWQCPAESGKNTCSGSGSGTIIGKDDKCRSCVIDGVPYVGNSDFEYRNNCLVWTDCRCRCDGSWRCAANSAKWVCENICRECEVDGRKYPGNTQFRHEEECTVYDPCTCHCNGTWTCPAKNGKWICTDKCLECEVNGKKHRGDTVFSLKEDCWQWDPCTCNCDGSWECPRENAKWVCTEKCLQCEANGKLYPGNTQFTYVDGCYEYNCNCDCNGRWSCPSNRTRDMCRLNMATGCYYCTVNGIKFEGNSMFSFDDKCKRYKNCTCNCDGSWECPGERAIDTCRRNSTTGCNYCDVYGQNVGGNTRFEIQQDCWKFDCECGCNGHWRCRETGAQYICGSQLLDVNGCKSCLAEGQRFQGQSTFEIKWGCVTYKCSCNCDGSWICPSRLAENSCSNVHFQNFLMRTVTNLPNSWCTECTIGGSVYPGYSQFQYQEKCTRQYVRCFCNGGLRFDSSIISGCTKSTQISKLKGNCIQCKFNNQVHAPNSDFEISSQCKRYKCRCECNGRTLCQSVTENVCGTVLTRSSTTVTGGGGGTVVVGGGGTSTTTVGRGRVVVTGGGKTVTTGNGGTLVVSGTTGTGVRTGGGTRTVVVGQGTRGQTTGTRTVVVGGGVPSSSSSTKETRVVVSSSGVRTVVTDGGSSSSGRTVVQVGGTGTGGVISTGTGTACYHCVGLDGTKYPGNSEFKFRRGCAVWKCQCHCSGRAICRPHDLSACLVESRCRDCVVDGRTYPSNRMFSYQKNCVTHQCRCMCDGQPRCVQTAVLDCQATTSRCRECIINGQRYPPNSMFDLETRCSKQRCQCECSGNHRCNAAVRTCEDDKPKDTCQPCNVSNVLYPAGSTFTVDRHCYRMTCSCSCRERLTCDQSAAQYICDTNRRKKCQACTVDNERYPPNSKFERDVGCMRVRCQCLCDGTHDCASSGVNICRDRGRGVVDTSRTTNTSTVGKESTKTETRTDVRTETRTRTDSRGTTSTSSTSSSEDNKNCKPCIADRIERKLGTTFCLDRGCKRYKCECYCNGRFACRTDKPENICDDAGKVVATPCQATTTESRTETSKETTDRQPSTTTGGGKQTTSSRITETSSTSQTSSSSTVFDFEERRGGVAVASSDRRGRCMQCNIQENYYEGNSQFALQLGCKRFRCRCNCDSSWQCPRQRPENTCTQETCRPCSLRGKEHPPNTRFTVSIDRCRKYQCSCPCNGRYTCPRDNIINTCDTPTKVTDKCTECNINGTRYRSNEAFSFDRDCDRFNCICKCDGSYDCPAAKTVNICNNPDTGRCRECTVNGQRYRGNTRFTFEKECDKFNCICKCDGSWECPPSKTENICKNPDTGRCRECTVNGQRYRGNARFSFEDTCFRFNCECYCNGSYNCPATQTQRLCRTPEECNYCDSSRYRVDVGSRDNTRRITETSQSSGSGSQGGSRTATTSRESGITGAGSRVESGTKIQTNSGSKTSSSSTTVGSSQTVTEIRSRSGSTSGSRVDRQGCRYCVVKGVEHRGRAVFEFEDNCFRFTCDCQCDGSWSCPAERIKNICKPTCRECTYNRIKYAPNTIFEYEDGCNRYSCDCACDGSYNCPAERTKDICGGRPSKCRECEVAGKKRAPERGFKFTEGCVEYNCHCNCDGSWQCPSERLKNICRPVASTTCSECFVNGKSYQPNKDFSYIEDCNLHRCRCNCDGSHTCPTTTDICKSSGEICRDCLVSGKRYLPNKPFQYTNKCERFNCECQCNGTWTCPADRTENLCSTGQCKSCTVRNKQYTGGSVFVVSENCRQFQCQCHCDGNWECSKESQNICDRG